MRADVQKIVELCYDMYLKSFSNEIVFLASGVDVDGDPIFDLLYDTEHTNDCAGYEMVFYNSKKFYLKTDDIFVYWCTEISISRYNVRFEEKTEKVYGKKEKKIWAPPYHPKYR